MDEPIFFTPPRVPGMPFLLHKGGGGKGGGGGGGTTQVVYRDPPPPPQVARAPQGGLDSTNTGGIEGAQMHGGGGAEGGASGLLSTRKKNLLG